MTGGTLTKERWCHDLTASITIISFWSVRHKSCDSSLVGQVESSLLSFWLRITVSLSLLASLVEIVREQGNFRLLQQPHSNVVSNELVVFDILPSVFAHTCAHTLTRTHTPARAHMYCMYQYLRESDKSQISYSSSSDQLELPRVNLSHRHIHKIREHATFQSSVIMLLQESNCWMDQRSLGSITPHLRHLLERLGKDTP